MKHRLAKYQFLVFLIAIGSRPACAQWHQVFGPAGGDVEALAADGSGTIYAGTDSGVYVSSDDGTTWTQERNGLTNPEIFSFAITTRRTVLAGTEGGGIFRSTNFGTSWDSSSSGLPDGSNILSLASDGRGDLFAGHSSRGVFYSSDDGLHWSARNVGMDSQTIFALTIAPNGTLYAGGERYIFASADQGLHWDTSLNTVYPGDEVLALAADSSGDVFAGTFLKQRFRLLLGHPGWEPISSLVSNSGDEVRALANVDDRIFIGLFGNGIAQSGDAGATWNNFSMGLSDPKVYSLAYSPDGYLFAGTSLGEVYRAQLGLSVADHGDSGIGIELWPQPANTLAYIVTALPPSRIEIVDPLGRVVQCLPGLRSVSGGYTLNTSQLPNGAFRVIVQTTSGVLSKQIIVQH